MVDDIVKRLRHIGGYDYCLEAMTDAADEIERLRAELAAAKAHAEEYAKESGRMDALVRELRAELAAANVRVEELEDDYKVLSDQLDSVLQRYDAARAELAAAKEDGESAHRALVSVRGKLAKHSEALREARKTMMKYDMIHYGDELIISIDALIGGTDENTISA